MTRARMGLLMAGIGIAGLNVFAACRVEQMASGVLLENELVHVVVHPDRGGTVGRFVLRSTGSELTATWADKPVGQGFGLFADRIVTASRQVVRDYEVSPYTAEVVKDTPEEVAVRVSGTSPTGVGRDVRFTKTYRLSNGSMELLVDYEVANISQGPILTSIWTCNHVRGGSPSDRLNYFYPTPKGTREEVYMPGPAGNNIYIEDAPVGWCAAIREKSNQGLAAAMDYPTLGTLYTFMPGPTADQDFPTLEWWTRNLLLNPVDPIEGEEWASQPWRSRMRVMPLQGMPRVDGYANGLAVAIEDVEGEARVTVLSATEREVILDVECVGVDGSRESGSRGRSPSKPLDGGDPLEGERPREPDEEIRLELTPGEPAVVVAGKLDSAAGAVVQVAVRVGDDVLCRFDRPFGPPEALVDYVIEPVAEKLPEPKIDTRARLTRSLVTPHVKWAAPSREGPLKVLFVVRSSMQREIVELAQRMDLDYHIVPTQYSHYTDTKSNAGLMFYYPGYDSMADLHQRLKNEKWDAVCVCSRYWSTIPEKTRGLLFDRVKQGMGLVNIRPYTAPAPVKEVFGSAPSDTGTAAICRGIPFGLLPALKEDPSGARWVTAIEWGDGRVVKLNYATHSPRDMRSDRTSIVPALQSGSQPEWPAYEYYYSLMARALHWAAGRLPQAPLSFEVTTAGGLTVGGDGDVRVRATAAAGDSIRYVLHRRAGGPLAEGVLPLRDDGTVSISLSRVMHAGPMLLDAWVMDGDRIVDWGSAVLNVASPVRAVRLVVPDVEYRAGATWTVPVVAEVDAPTEGLRLVLTAEDMQDRLVWRSEHTVAARQGTNRWECPLRILSPVTVRHRIRAKVLQGDLRLGEGGGVLYARVPKLAPNFRFLVWSGGWRSHVGTIAREQMKGIGLTDYQISADAVGDQAMSNDEMRGYCDEILRDDVDISLMGVNWMGGRTRKDNPLVREYCLDDPEYMQRVREGIPRALAGLDKMGVRTASTGDEISFGQYGGFNDLCQGSHTIRAFRNWLQQRYGSIAHLNREWETEYVSFDDVLGITWADMEGRSNKAAWVEFRTYTDVAMTSYLQTFNTIMKATIPGIKAGFDGNSQLSSYNGFDWWRISGVCDFMTLYRTGQMHYYLSSFFPARGVDPHFSTWTSTSLIPRILQSTIWRRLFRGMSGVDYWYAPILLNPDFTVNEYGVVLARELPEIQHGIGTLLMNSRREQDPVAILYSQASLHAASIEGRSGRPGPGELSDAHYGWASVIEDAGLTPEFVSYEQLANGYLAAAGHRVLVLALCYALSDAEVKQIEAFVKGGGLLLADSVPGRYSGYGRRLAAGQLNALLGIEKTDEAQPQARSVAIRGLGGLETSGDVSFNMPWPTVDQDMRVVDAVSLGEGAGLEGTLPVRMGDVVIRSGARSVPGVSALAYARRGRGHTIWLNLPMWRYDELRGTQRGQQFVEWLGDVLSKTVRVEASVPVLAEGKPVPELAVTRWREGDALYAGLVKRANSRSGEQEAEVIWPAKGVVYDLRSTRPPAREARSRLRVSSDQARLLAWLPYGVMGVNCESPESVAPLTPVDVAIEVLSDGPVGPATGPTAHVLRCAVIGPGGAGREAYQQNVIAENGAGMYRFSFALNDPAGEWRIHVRDVVSGQTGEAVVQLVSEPAEK